MITREDILYECMAQVKPDMANPGQLNRMVAQANRAIDQAIRATLQRGWWFNTEVIENVIPTEDGYIPDGVVPGCVIDARGVHYPVTAKVESICFAVPEPPPPPPPPAPAMTLYDSNAVGSTSDGLLRVGALASMQFVASYEANKSDAGPLVGISDVTDGRWDYTGVPTFATITGDNEAIVMPGFFDGPAGAYVTGSAWQGTFDSELDPAIHVVSEIVIGADLPAGEFWIGVATEGDPTSDMPVPSVGGPEDFNSGAFGFVEGVSANHMYAGKFYFTGVSSAGKFWLNSSAGVGVTPVLGGLVGPEYAFGPGDVIGCMVVARQSNGPYLIKFFRNGTLIANTFMAGTKAFETGLAGVFTMSPLRFVVANSFGTAP